MCIKILMAEGKLKPTEYNFLLKGGVVLDRDEQAENPSPDWISEMAWDNITELDKLSGFHGISDSFAESTEEWKEWFSSSEPEVTPLIGEYRNFSQFSQMMIIRSLRADRMSFCLTAFIEHELGRRVRKQSHFEKFRENMFLPVRRASNFEPQVHFRRVYCQNSTDFPPITWNGPSRWPLETG
jgi:hypothetical protein